jgi:hypothetical protein
VHPPKSDLAPANNGIHLNGDSFTVSIPKLYYEDDLTDKCSENHQSLDVVSGASPQVVQFVLRCPSLSGFFEEQVSKPNKTNSHSLDVSASRLEPCLDDWCTIEVERKESDVFVGARGSVHFKGDCLVDTISFEYPIVMPVSGSGATIYMIPLWGYAVFFVTVLVLLLILWQVVKKLRRTKKELKYERADISSGIGLGSGSIEITTTES